MELIYMSTIAAVSSVAYGWFFNAPRKSLVGAFFCGFIGWFAFSISQRFINNSFITALLGAFFLGLLSEILCRIYKLPVTVFIIPGIIPLVPGAGMYYTMYNFVIQDYVLAMENGRQALFLAGGISFGVLLASIFSRSLRVVRNKSTRLFRGEKHEYRQ